VPADAVEHLALNVYRWGEDAQDRVVARCVGPAVRALVDAGAVRRFWFTRFDARGPHVALFVGAPADRAEEAGAALSDAIGRGMAADPCTAVIAPEELEKRHDACRGAELSSIDAEPGFAPGDSLRIAPHPADGFLLRETATVADAAQDELWELMTELALWSAGRLGAQDAAGAAAHWIAAVDGALHRAGAPAEGWWRWYATTLMVGLADRIRDGGDDFAAAIPALLGERNLAAMERVWAEADRSPRRWEGVGRLIELVAADDGRRTELQRFRLFRLLNHSVLAQLARPVRLRTPLALFAWHRARTLAPAAA